MATDPQIKVRISAHADELSAAIAKVRRDLASLPALANQVNRRVASGGASTFSIGAVRSEFERLYGGARSGVGRGLGLFGAATRSVPGLGALAGAASIAGVGELMSRYAGGGIALRNTARLAGTSASGLNSRRGAARLIGLSAGDADQAMSGLNHTIADAVYGRNPQAAVLFHRFGIAIGDMAKGARSAEGVLPRVVDEITRLNKSDPRKAERLANAWGIPSSALPLLIQGREALAANRKEVERIYGSMDKYQASSERFTASTARLGMASERLGMTIMTSLEPHLSPLLLRLSSFVEAHDQDIGRAFDNIGTAIGHVDWKGVGDGVERIGGYLSSAVARADDFATRLNRVKDTLRAVVEIVQTPGRWWNERFQRDAAGVGRPDSNGYQIGDPSRLSALDQAIVLAGRYSRAGPGSYRYASPRERLGFGGGGALPLGPGAAPISNPEQARRARQGRDILVGLGWTPAQAAGIMANLDRESKLTEGAVGDNRQAYGVAQWHADRRAKIAAGMGRSVVGMSFEDQVKAVDWELRNTERAAGDALRRTRTAAEAGAAVSRYYERPRDTEGEAAARARSADYWDRHNPALPAAAAAQSNNGSSSTVRIEIDHSNVPAGVNMRASTQGDGAEIGGIRIRRAMPDAGAINATPGLGF